MKKEGTSDHGSGEVSKPVEKIPQKPRSRGKSAKQLVDEHINDKNDVISEEAFRDMELDLGVPKDEAHQPLPITNDEERPKDEDKDKKIITPWDVID